jgi:hypothetical protein
MISSFNEVECSDNRTSEIAITGIVLGLVTIATLIAYFTAIVVVYQFVKEWRVSKRVSIFTWGGGAILVGKERPAPKPSRSHNGHCSKPIDI